MQSFKPAPIIEVSVSEDLFQSLTRDSNHSNLRCGWGVCASDDRFNPSRGIAIIQTWPRSPSGATGVSFNPSRGIAIIQTTRGRCSGCAGRRFQSLTRDSNHSNPKGTDEVAPATRFNPSRGIAIIQTSPLPSKQAAR